MTVDKPHTPIIWQKEILTFIVQNSWELKTNQISEVTRKNLLKVIYQIQWSWDLKDIFNEYRVAFELKNQHIIEIFPEWFGSRQTTLQYANTIQKVISDSTQQIIQTAKKVTIQWIEIWGDIYEQIKKLCNWDLIKTVGDKFKDYIWIIGKFFADFHVDISRFKTIDDLIQFSENTITATNSVFKSLPNWIRKWLITAFVGAMMLLGTKFKNIQTDQSSENLIWNDWTNISLTDIKTDDGRWEDSTIVKEWVISKKWLHFQKSDEKETIEFEEDISQWISYKKIQKPVWSKIIDIFHIHWRTDKEWWTPACAKSARILIDKYFDVTIAKRWSAKDVHNFYQNTSDKKIKSEYPDFQWKVIGENLTPHLGVSLQKLENKWANVIDMFITSPNSYKKVKIIKSKGWKKRKIIVKKNYWHRVIAILWKDSKERYVINGYAKDFKKPQRRETFVEWCDENHRKVQSIAWFKSKVSVTDKEVASKKDQRLIKRMTKQLEDKTILQFSVAGTKKSMLKLKKFEKKLKTELVKAAKNTPYIIKNLQEKKRVWWDNVWEIIEDWIKDSGLPLELKKYYRGIVLQESKWDKDADNWYYEWLAQIWEDDAEWVGLNLRDRKNPTKAVPWSLELLENKYTYLKNSKYIKRFMEKYDLDEKHFLYPLVINSYCAWEWTMEKIVKNVISKKHEKHIRRYIEWYRLWSKTIQEAHWKRWPLVYVMDNWHNYSRIYNAEKKNYVPLVAMRTEQVLWNGPVTELVWP